MGWARFDDNYTDHPKVVEAGPWAELLDMRAIIHCARYETDGLVTRSALRRLSRDIPKAPSRVLALIESGRWSVNEGGGWWVHDFLEFNPSKAEKQRQREAGRDRVRKHRSNAVTNASRSRGGDGDLLKEFDENAKRDAVPPPWTVGGERPLSVVPKAEETA